MLYSKIEFFGVPFGAEKIPVEPEADNTDEGIKISSRLLNKGPFF
jgi:hypothetical protein